MAAAKGKKKATKGGALQNALAGLNKVIKNSDDLAVSLDH